LFPSSYQLFHKLTAPAGNTTYTQVL